MVRLQRAAQGKEHALAALAVRFRDVHRLETALKRGVLFDVLAVLLRRRRADDLYLAPAQGGLEDVRGVDGALGGAGADDGVQLVDKDDDVPGTLHLLYDALDPVLEVAAVLRAGEHGGEVEGDYAAVFERVRHLAAGDAAGQRLRNGGLAHAGLAHEDGVVFGAAGEDLYDAAYLTLPAHDGIGASAACYEREVAAVLVQDAGLGAAVGRTQGGLTPALFLAARAALGRAEEGHYVRVQLVGAAASGSQGPRGGAVRRAHQPQQQMLCAYAAVAQPAGVLRGALYRQARVGRQALLRRARLPAARLRRHQPREREHVQAPREQHPRAKALRLRRHAEQQMLRADVAVPKRGRCVPRRGYRARGAFCEPCAVFHAFSLPPVPL